MNTKTCCTVYSTALYSSRRPPGRERGASAADRVRVRRVAAHAVRGARAGRVGRDHRARHAAHGPAALALPAHPRARRGRGGGRVLGRRAARRLLVHARPQARLLGRHRAHFRYSSIRVCTSLSAQDLEGLSSVRILNKSGFGVDNVN